MKFIKRKVLVMLALVVTMIGFNVTQTNAAQGKMAIAVGGGFIVEPTGDTKVFGWVYDYVVGSGDAQTQIQDRPMAGAKVEVFEGYLYLDEYDSRTPITVGYTNDKGEFSIPVKGVEQDRAAFSFRVTKDQETTAYCGKGSGSYVEYWPTISLTTQDVTINKGDTFSNDMCLVDIPSYVFWNQTLTGDYGTKTKFKTEISGDVDPNVAGVYDVTITSTVQVYNNIAGVHPIHTFVDSRIETQTVKVTVLETDSTASVHYVNEDGESVETSEHFSGKIGDPFTVEVKAVAGHDFKEVQYPANSSATLDNQLIPEHQDIYVVYTKKEVANVDKEDDTSNKPNEEPTPNDPDEVDQPDEMDETDQPDTTPSKPDTTPSKPDTTPSKPNTAVNGTKPAVNKTPNTGDTNHTGVTYSLLIMSMLSVVIVVKNRKQRG